jgi:hypothetical protein
VSYIGVVSVVSQYNYVCYCDTLRGVCEDEVGDSVYVSYVGVVSVVSQYNYVCYCDTLRGVGEDEIGNSEQRQADGEGMYVCMYVCRYVCRYVCMYVGVVSVVSLYNYVSYCDTTPT